METQPQATDAQERHEPADPRPGWNRPRLASDLPVEGPGAVVHNELVLSGWTVSPVGISGVIVQIDDRLLHAAYGLETPWLAEAMPDMTGADRAGYRLTLDTSGWTPGRREITITAYDQAGGREDIVGTVDVVPFKPPVYTTEDRLAALAEGGIAFALEWPSLGEGHPEIENPIEISGWAYAAGGLDAVLVTIDGQARYEALHPIARPDLLDDYGEEVAARAGFALQLHARDCPPGGHRLSIVAIDKERRAVGLETDFTSLPEQPPTDPPESGAAMEIDWLPAGRSPRASQPQSERYDPERDAGSLREASYQLRYQLAASLAAGKEVLDVGCGGGGGSELLAQAGAASVIGLDSDEEPLGALPFDDGSFDLIACFETIECATDPESALDELRRVLRADGVLLIGVDRHHSTERATTTPGEVERALRDRFANVRIHRQRTVLASAVIGDLDLEGLGEDAHEIAVRKLGEWRPGGEDTLLALASDGELPELERAAAFAAPRALRTLRDTLRTWEDRVLLSDADAAASRNEANLAKMHQRATLRESRDYRQEAQALRRSLDELQVLLASRTAELEDVKQLAESHAAELESQATLLEDTKQLAERHAAELGRQASELAATERRANEAEAAVGNRDSSLSWRITRPLRTVKRGTLRARDTIRRR